MASFISQYFLDAQPRASKNIVSGVSVDIALVTASFALVATDKWVSDATLGEINVTGYTPGYGEAGRRTLSGVTITLGASGVTVFLDASDVSWTSLATGATITGAAMFARGPTGDTTALMIAFYDLTDTPTNGSGITVAWNASGFLKYYRAAGS